MARKSVFAIVSIVRLIIALAVLSLFAYAYLSHSLYSNSILSPLVNWQFSPALYVASAALIAIIAATLIFGRVYCSVLCPLGTLQEIFWRLGKLLQKRFSSPLMGIIRRGKSPPRSSPASGSSATPSTGGAPPRNAPPPYKASARLFRRGYKEPPKARYAVPLLVAAGVIFSLTPLMVLFDPISIFGRAAGALRSLLSSDASPFSLYLAAALVIILIAAFFRGRPFCSFCPVGISLGIFSKIAPVHVKISLQCASCGICEKQCPAGCIDSKAKHIDSERCVLCFSCTAVCPSGSAAYGVRGKTAVFSEDRRTFLKSAGIFSLLCGVPYLLSPIFKLPQKHKEADPANLHRGESLPILPPGAKNIAHYTGQCIACHACIASCPANIIKAKNNPHPQIYYSGDATASCQFSCTECGRVCPTGAINRLSVEEKRRTRIALSTLYFERCVVKTKYESCGACAEVCPTGALTMVAYDESGVPFLTMPIYDKRYCIGCGACLAACPAEPRAFTIAAVSEQNRTIGVRPLEEAGDELHLEDLEGNGDFPF